MNAVLSMVDRQTGQLRSVVLDNVTANNVTNVLGANVAQDTRLLTDSSNVYRRMGSALAGHEAVNHSVGEYVRVADPTVHTNTVEGTFSIFKRGCAASISTARASTFIAIWRNLTSGIPTASRSALMTRPAPKTRSRACVVSASPTKQLVAGGPPPKAGSSGNQRWFTKPHRWPRRHTAQLELPFGE